MKKILLLIPSLILMSHFAYSSDLNIEITNKKPVSGTLNIELYRLPIKLDHEDNWKYIISIASHTFELTGDAKTQIFKIKNIAAGDLCARSFLDLNANKILDRSPMGLPKEPVGFANNPALMFGEPSPKDACFEVTADPYELHIKLQQKKRKKP